MGKKQLKPWMVFIFILVFWLDIFVMGDLFGKWFGVYGTLLGEILLVVLGVGMVALLRADIRTIFPFKRPETTKIAGTIVLWLGTFLAAMGIVGVIVYFFPQQMMGAGQNIQDMVISLPAWFSLFLLALTPAVCEEMAFRGAFLGCFRGEKNKWIGILITSVVFGIFHGSVWRAIPTAILGLAMGYLLIETNNMIYNMLFHFINNALPTILLLLIAMMSSGVMDQRQMAEAQQMAGDQISLMVMAVYLMYSSGAPLLIYIGNYLIHRGNKGYTKGLFPREKRWLLLLFITVSVFLLIMGILLLWVSILIQFI